METPCSSSIESQYDRQDVNHRGSLRYEDHEQESQQGGPLAYPTALPPPRL